MVLRPKGARVALLPIDRIVPNPGQPRHHFDQTALEELAASIRRYGILQPLTVRQTAGGWALVAGERRLDVYKRQHTTCSAGTEYSSCPLPRPGAAPAPV